MKNVTGTVKDGVVIPSEPLDLPDGSRVLVVGIPSTDSDRDWWLQFAGIWRDDAGIDSWAHERSVSDDPRNSRVP